LLNLFGKRLNLNKADTIADDIDKYLRTLNNIEYSSKLDEYTENYLNEIKLFLIILKKQYKDALINFASLQREKINKAITSDMFFSISQEDKIREIILNTILGEV
jgi:hypothetical protein